MKPDPETLAWAEEEARNLDEAARIVEAATDILPEIVAKALARRVRSALRGPTRPYGEWRREMDMVERVAGALGQFEMNDAADLRRAARAAIEAMREPTEAMLAAADSAIPQAVADERGVRMHGRDVALEAWRACIDTALSPSRMEPKDE